MIADEVGVTKAAVYHQYRTKEEIVRAAAGAEFDRVEAVLTAAESEPLPDRARDAVLTAIIDLAVVRRREMSTILTDPIVGRLLAKDRRPIDLVRRLNGLLVNREGETESEMATVMLIAAISGAVMHPLAIRRDDDMLRAELRRLAERFLGLSA